MLGLQASLLALAVFGANRALSPHSFVDWIIFWASTLSLLVTTAACAEIIRKTQQQPAKGVWFIVALALGLMLVGEVLENIDYLHGIVNDFSINDAFFFSSKFIILGCQVWAVLRLIRRQTLRRMAFDLLASLCASGTLLWFVFATGNPAKVALINPADLWSLRLSAVLDTIIIFNVFTLAMRAGPEGTALNYVSRLSLLLGLLMLSSGDLQWVADKLNGKAIEVNSVSILLSHLAYILVGFAMWRFDDGARDGAGVGRLPQLLDDLGPFAHVLVAFVLIYIIGFNFFQPLGRMLYVALVFTVIMLMIRQALSFRARLTLQTQLAVNFAEAQLHSWYRAHQPDLALPAGGVGIASLPTASLAASLWLSSNDKAQLQSRIENDPTSGAASYDLLSARTRNLTAALELGWFVPWYQPIYDAVTGKVSSLELLLRCNHPEHGFLEPKSFIAEIEAAGLSGQAIRRVLPMALEDRQMLMDAGVVDRFTTMAVNVTARDLEDFRFVDDIARLLETHDVPGSRLCLELTERMIADLPVVDSKGFRALRKSGVQFCIDDFGTGYSSLAYLDRLAPDIVKIDRCFVTDIESRPGLAQLVHTIVDMTNRLGIKLVIEGVETAGQLQILRDMGCRHFQGYFFGYPRSAEVLLTELKEKAVTSQPGLAAE